MTRKLSITGLLLMVTAVAGLYYTHALFSKSPLAIGIQAVAVALITGARVTFGRKGFHAAANPMEGGLVTTGPYRYLRRLSIAGLFLMVIAVVGLYYTHALFSKSPVAIGIQVLAVALMIWARVTFGRRSFHAAANPTEGGLVTTGPYRFIRHPIYTAGCMFCWAGVVAHPSAVSFAAGTLLLIGATLRMVAEERLLVERYPEYRQYAGRTKRMVPLVF